MHKEDESFAVSSPIKEQPNNLGKFYNFPKHRYEYRQQ